MGFVKWLMKGVNIEESRIEVEGDIPPEPNSVPSVNTNVGMETLKNLAEMEKSQTVTMGNNAPVYNTQSAPNMPNQMGYAGANNYGNMVSPYFNANQNPSVYGNAGGNVKIFKIFGKPELNLAVAHLSRGQACIVKFERMSRGKRGELMLYLSGALFALNASMSNLKDKMYMLSPRGMQVSVQSKTKKVK